MKMRRALHSFRLSMVLVSACAVTFLACSKDPEAPSRVAVHTLTLGAYTTPREVYGREILPAFARHWKERTGGVVEFQESYLASGAQSRAIVDGFAADVAALSLEADIERIAEAGLITHDWRSGPAGGMVCRSIVVLAVRAGNPKNIRDWDDLRRSDVKVLTPSPRTSGGAMWNIAALYGAVLRGATSAPRDDPQAAEAFLRDVLKNVEIMDKGARESMITFENGIGDVAITYENEVLVGRIAGKDYAYVVPRATILIENPVAVVDRYAEAHGNQELAAAFVEFLLTPEAQRAFGRFGLRAVDAEVMKELDLHMPRVSEPFTIRDLGGWPQVIEELFAAGAAFERASAAAQEGR